MSRVSIFGLVGALVLALLWLAIRFETARSGSSADSRAPIATPDTPARAELLPPATAEEVAASPMAREERSARRSDASKSLPTISGRVVVPGGIPAQEHASVAAEVYVGRVNQRGNTRQISTPVAADGSFSLAVPEDTRYALLDVEATALELPEGVRALPGESEVILRPNVLAWVEGRVIPPPGTTLSASSAWLEIVVRCGPAGAHPTENTAEDRNPFLGIHPDERGRFEIPLLPIGVPLSLRVEHPFGRAQELELDPLLAGERREVLVTLDRGVTVAGRVLDEHGRPVEGVSVSVHLHRPGLSFTQQSSDDPKTDGEGRFSLAKLQRAALEIAAYGEDLLEPAKVLVDGTAGDALGLEVHVTRGACIEGTVVWPDGTPVESFDVDAVGPNGRSKSFAGGRFRLRVPEDGLYDLKATAARATVVGTAQARGVRAGGPILTLVLETKPAVQVDGTVVDDGGEPVESFSVLWAPAPESLVRHWESSAGDAGHFHLGGLQSGALTITVMAQGFRASTKTLEIGALPTESVRFVLIRAGSVRGQVVGTDGRGVAEAEVSCGGSSCRTAQDGDFELEPATSPLYLVARKEGYAPSEPLELDIAPGEIVEGVSLCLREGCRIEGRVLDAGGRPVAGALVQAMGSIWDSAEVDEHGAFVLQNLPPGPQEIRASLRESSWQVVQANVDLRPGRTATLELRFDEPDPVRLHGRIRRQGKPSACSLFLDSPTSYASVRIGPDGLCEATVARPGDFVGLLRIEGVDLRRLELHVPDVDDFDFEVDFDTLPSLEK